MTQLVKYEAARAALAEVHAVDEVKGIRDKAIALKAYAREAKDTELVRYATEIRLRAERRAGELLRDMADTGQRATVGKPVEANTNSALVLPHPPTLADLHISDIQSSRWQKLAAIPEELFEKRVAEAKDGATAASARILHQQVELDRPPAPFPTNGKYRVIYADPPWHYGTSKPDYYGPAVRHYPTMKVDALCALDVEGMAEDNAVLFLWVTSPKLDEAFQIIPAWGFTYKTSFVWDKIKHNFGHYNSVRHEFLLIATRGSCTPDIPDLVPSVQRIERTEHSAKPAEFRAIIDRLYPHGSRIELFARANVTGWDRWGNEP